MAASSLKKARIVPVMSGNATPEPTEGGSHGRGSPRGDNRVKWG